MAPQSKGNDFSSNILKESKTKFVRRSWKASCMHTKSVLKIESETFYLILLGIARNKTLKLSSMRSTYTDLILYPNLQLAQSFFAHTSIISTHSHSSRISLFYSYWTVPFYIWNGKIIYALSILYLSNLNDDSFKIHISFSKLADSVRIFSKQFIHYLLGSCLP